MLPPLPKSAPPSASRIQRLWLGWQRWWRFHHLSVVHRSKDPHGEAQSFALGVFLGFMPLSVGATVLALIIPRRLGWRTIPAVVGTFAGNWITAPFILGASAVVGRLVTTGEWTGFKALIEVEGSTWQEKIDAYLQLGASFFLGITLVSLAAAFVSYLVMNLLIRAAVRLRQQRLVEKLKQKLHVHGHSHPDHPHGPEKK